MSKSKKFILWFKEIDSDDVGLVGGKNASLGEMVRALKSKGINIPNGFAVTAQAYQTFLRASGLKPKIKSLLKGLNTRNLQQLQATGAAIRHLIVTTTLPTKLAQQIKQAYQRLEKEYGQNVDVAVRSSATAEDLPTASFAGQHETYLNIRGAPNVIKAVQRSMASLFTNRGISYRVDKGFDHFKVSLSVGVQKMVRSDSASSGVIFTLDTESGFRDVVYLTSTWGLGEIIVQGKVIPDEFYIFKPTLALGFSPIIRKKIGSKSLKIIYAPQGGTRQISVRPKDRHKSTLTDKEVLTLAKWAVAIEEHYTKKAKRDFAMDIEWAKDGQSGELFIVQARPETVHSAKNKNILEVYSLKTKGSVLVFGQSIGSKIGQGQAKIILDPKDIGKFNQGEVLITDMTDPDWEPIMKKASAIVTDKGGRTSHAAIVSRELGIPAIVGTENATRKIKTNVSITIDCSQGEVGYVYKGLLPYEVKKINVAHVPKTKTKIMMNIGTPAEAFENSFLPNQGVGLAREEFIIASNIKIHPLALINFNKLKDKKIKRTIEKLTVGYRNKVQYFVDELAYGIAQIAAAFYPKEVIVRFSDFKTNEYASLVGGQAYEPKEENPMIGFRGASRYYSPLFKPAFLLECRAVKKVREELGLTNLMTMIPFCRTVEEGKKVLQIMKEAGLRQGVKGLKVYVMCEIPSNVILAKEFLKIFDGFSIGSNDLTQLTLGIDRDGQLVQGIGDERNQAVKIMLKEAIVAARSQKKYIGICGQAPSDYEEIVNFLLKEKIESISLNPDSVLKTTLLVSRKEKQHG